METLSRRGFLGTIPGIALASGHWLNSRSPLPTVSITFKHKSLVVHRHNETWIVFPETGHKLLCGGKPIEGDFSLVARNGNGVRLETTRTLPVDDTYVPQLDAVAGVPVRLKDERHVLRNAAAVIRLSGGRIVSGPAERPEEEYADSQWTYRKWRGRLTNWIRWEYSRTEDVIWTLEGNGKARREISASEPLVITNSTLHGGGETTDDEVYARSFDSLYDFVEGAFLARPIAPKTRRVHTNFGWGIPIRPLCPVGQLRS